MVVVVFDISSSFSYIHTCHGTNRVSKDNDNDDIATGRISSSSSSSSSSTRAPPKYRWPSQGMVRFQDVCLRYRPGLPLVLAGTDNTSMHPHALIVLVLQYNYHHHHHHDHHHHNTTIIIKTHRLLVSLS